MVPGQVDGPQELLEIMHLKQKDRVEIHACIETIHACYISLLAIIEWNEESGRGS